MAGEPACEHRPSLFVQLDETAASKPSARAGNEIDHLRTTSHGAGFAFVFDHEVESLIAAWRCRYANREAFERQILQLRTLPARSNQNRGWPSCTVTIRWRVWRS